jgi:hypothetical protein
MTDHTYLQRLAYGTDQGNYLMNEIKNIEVHKKSEVKAVKVTARKYPYPPEIYNLVLQPDEVKLGMKNVR